MIACFIRQQIWGSAINNNEVKSIIGVRDLTLYKTLGRNNIHVLLWNQNKAMFLYLIVKILH